MDTSTLISWGLLVVLVLDAGNQIRSHLTGRASGKEKKTGSLTPVLSVVTTVLIALFFAQVIEWNTVVPVPLWWPVAALVAAAVGLTVYRLSAPRPAPPGDGG